LANDRVSIKVEPDIHAIVGENGAGKSTAMRIAYGFYTADSGEIVIAGRCATFARPTTRLPWESAWFINTSCWLNR